MEMREIMADSANRFNLLVKTFKQANPNLTQSDDSKAYHDFRDSKIGKNWRETHVYIFSTNCKMQ